MGNLSRNFFKLNFCYHNSQRTFTVIFKIAQPPKIGEITTGEIYIHRMSFIYSQTTKTHKKSQRENCFIVVTQIYTSSICWCNINDITMLFRCHICPSLNKFLEGDTLVTPY